MEWNPGLTVISSHVKGKYLNSLNVQSPNPSAVTKSMHGRSRETIDTNFCSSAMAVHGEFIQVTDFPESYLSATKH